MDKIQLPETVEECHQVIRDLMQAISKIELKVDQLSRRVKELETENQALKERLGLNSLNSSLPPSRDHQKAKQKRPSSGLSSGGQPGHVGRHRHLLESTEVDSIIHCPLPPKCTCGAEIKNSQEVQRHQVYELPYIKLHVTEYQLEKGRCQTCHRSHVADLPTGVSWGMTGPRLTSFMSLLVAKYQLSRRGLQELLKEHFQFSISLGTVFNKQKIVNQVLASPVTALLPAIKQSHCVHMDETGHRQEGQRAWMWVIASEIAVYYEIVHSRGVKALKNWMHDFEFVVVSDRYGIYNYFPSEHRQLCWSHLKRDFTRLAEKKEPLMRRIGHELLHQTNQLFQYWHQFKKGHITREELMGRCEPIRRRVGECLEQCTYTDPAWRISRFAKNVLKHFYALWTFLSEEAIEPTNNHAERCLRPWVIWRKKYLGTRSVYGTEYVARCASWIMTCKLQSKSAFEYLNQAVKNHFSHTPPSPLIFT